MLCKTTESRRSDLTELAASVSASVSVFSLQSRALRATELAQRPECNELH